MVPRPMCRIRDADNNLRLQHRMLSSSHRAVPPGRSCTKEGSRRYFGTKVRYSGVGYNLASIFAGALSPLIATWLMVEYKPATWPISVYMIILAVITLVSVYFAVETRQKVKPELRTPQARPA
jgi:hypothetical protein